MYRTDLYLLLSLPNAPRVSGECHRLPLTPDAIRDVLIAALTGNQPPLKAAPIPVVTDRPENPNDVAAIAWAVGAGRYRPLETYEIWAGKDIYAVAQAIEATQEDIQAAVEPLDDQYLLGGLTIHGMRLLMVSGQD